MPRTSGDEVLEIRSVQQERTGEAIDLGMWLGRREAFAMMAGRCSAADAECLREVRRKKGYRALQMTWEQFCVQRLGLARATADRIVRQLEEFGPEFFTLAQLTRVTPEEYRRLGVAVRGHALLHAGEEIPIEAENGPRLAAAIEELRRNVKAGAPSGMEPGPKVIDVEAEPVAEREASAEAEPATRQPAGTESAGTDLTGTDSTGTAEAGGNASEPAAADAQAGCDFTYADRSLRATLTELHRLQSLKLDMGEKMRLHSLVGYGAHEFRLLELAVHF